MSTLSAMPPSMVKGQINIRLSDQGKQYLQALTRRYGLSQGGLIEMLLRDRVVELKQKEGFSPKPKLGD